jgi:hypothetical protein
MHLTSISSKQHHRSGKNSSSRLLVQEWYKNGTSEAALFSCAKKMPRVKGLPGFPARARRFCIKTARGARSKERISRIFGHLSAPFGRHFQ